MKNPPFAPLLHINTLTSEEAGHDGEKLVIQYQFEDTQFGSICLASTTRGICALFFVDSKREGVSNLHTIFPSARFEEAKNSLLTRAHSYFTGISEDHSPLPLHLKGTAFQFEVWKALSSVSAGSLATYGSVATQIGRPTACRAVGTAIGKNPVAFLIPCHRVIQANGQLGNYRWGADRKRKIIEWEAATHCLVDQKKRTV